MLKFQRFIAAALSFAVLVVNSNAEPCQCSFSSADPADCVVYGQLGDGNLIPWSVASQECLDTFNIKDEAMDPTSLANIFPSPDGTGGSVSGFVNYLRFDDGSVASSIKAGFPQFYVESDVQPGKMVLRDEITVDGTTTACSSDMGGSESDCYTAMKTYFGMEPGASEMAGIGQQLYNAAAVSREKEQSIVRIRLCQEGPTAECGALSDQVQEVMTANPDKFCSAYGLGPAGYDYPKCSGGDGATTNSTGSTDDEGETFDPTRETIDPNMSETSAASSKIATGGALFLVIAVSLVKTASAVNRGDYTTL